MKNIKRFLLMAITIAFLVGMNACESNKQACPTYTYHNSLPEKKKDVKPGEQAPPKQTSSKPKSGVMPKMKHTHQKVY